jgi:cytochrome d ubiquinol oxidase subunit I
MEGLWNDTSCAPFYLIGWVDESSQTTKGLYIPCLLSFLAYADFDATVTGLNSFNSDDWAPVNLTFQAYHLMIDLGSLFGLIGVVSAGLYYWKAKIFQWRWILRVLVVMVPLVIITIIAGWWTTEIGRQPWVVWNLLRTEDGVSPTLTGGMVTFSLATFIVLYALLLVLFLYLLNGMIQRGPALLEEVEEAPVGSLPDSFREVFRRRAPRAHAPEPEPVSSRNPGEASS